MAERDQYIRLAEAVERLHAAGYDDSQWTVRRMADAGVLKSYRLRPSGHRRISAASVEDLIVKRGAESNGGTPADGEAESGVTPDGQGDVSP